MDKNKKALFGIVAAAIVLCVVVAFMVNRGGHTEKNKDVIRVACNLPMTGNLGMIGEYIDSGIKMAMDELRNSFEADGVELFFEYNDNTSQPKDAVSIFNLQKIKGFDIYMTAGTAEAAAILEPVKDSGKPHFIWGFEPFSLKKSDHLFRHWIDMEYEGKCFIKYIENYKPKTISFIYENISSTQAQFGTIVKPYVESQGIKILNDECYDISTTNFRDIVTKVSAANPDLVIIYGFQSHLVEIIKGLNTSGLKKKGNVLCSFDFLDVQSILEPQLLDGIVTNVPIFLVDNTDRINSWKEKFHSIYGRSPVYTDAYAYDLAYTIYYAAKLGKENGESIEKNLFKVNFDGITGRIRYLESGQLEYNVQPSIYTNGQFQSIE